MKLRCMTYLEGQSFADEDPRAAVKLVRTPPALEILAPDGSQALAIENDQVRIDWAAMEKVAAQAVATQVTLFDLPTLFARALLAVRSGAFKPCVAIVEAS